MVHPFEIRFIHDMELLWKSPFASYDGLTGWNHFSKGFSLNIVFYPLMVVHPEKRNVIENSGFRIFCCYFRCCHFASFYFPFEFIQPKHMAHHVQRSKLIWLKHRFQHYTIYILWMMYWFGVFLLSSHWISSLHFNWIRSTKSPKYSRIHTLRAHTHTHITSLCSSFDTNSTVMWCDTVFGVRNRAFFFFLFSIHSEALEEVGKRPKSV